MFARTQNRSLPACLVSASCHLGTAAPTAVSVQRFYKQVRGQEKLLPILVCGTGVSPACDMQHKADLAVCCPAQCFIPWCAACASLECSTPPHMLWRASLGAPVLGKGFLELFCHIVTMEVTGV